MQQEFSECLFICAAITTGIGVGVLVFHGIGLLIIKLREYLIERMLG
jgi:hypothetical protein